MKPFSQLSSRGQGKFIAKLLLNHSIKRGKVSCSGNNITTFQRVPVRAPTVREMYQLLQIFLLLLLYPFVGVHHNQSQIADSESSFGWSLIQQWNSLKIQSILLTVLLHTTFHLRINERAGGLPASGLKTASENKGEKSILPVWKICSLVISDNQSTLLYIEWNCKTMMYMLSWIRSLAVFCSNIAFFFRVFMISSRENYIAISSNGNT